MKKKSRFCRSETAGNVEDSGGECTARNATRENPLEHRNVDFVHGRGDNKAASCVISSTMPYLMTGVIQAAVDNFLLQGHQLASGFVSACQTVGHRELLGQIENFAFVQLKSTQAQSSVVTGPGTYIEHPRRHDKAYAPGDK